MTGPDPFSRAGRFEQARRDAAQQRAQEALAANPETVADVAGEAVKLRGCPSGHDAADAMVIGGPGTAAGPEFWVGCSLCRWRTIGDTEAEAVALWNERKGTGRWGRP